MGLHEVATFNSTKVQLQRYLQDFIFAHDVVMVQYPPVSPVHIAWNQEQTFDVQYLLYGEPMVRQSTQIAFTSEFVSNVQVVLNLSVEDCTMSNRFVYYVIENHDGLHDVYEQSMRLRFSKFNSDYSSFSGMVRGRCRLHSSGDSLRAPCPLTDRCSLCLVAQKHAIAVAILVGEILFVIIPIVLAVRELPRDGTW